MHSKTWTCMPCFKVSNANPTTIQLLSFVCVCVCSIYMWVVCILHTVHNAIHKIWYSDAVLTLLISESWKAIPLCCYSLMTISTQKLAVYLCINKKKCNLFWSNKSKCFTQSYCGGTGSWKNVASSAFAFPLFCFLFHGCGGWGGSGGRI